MDMATLPMRPIASTTRTMRALNPCRPPVTRSPSMLARMMKRIQELATPRRVPTGAIILPRHHPAWIIATVAAMANMVDGRGSHVLHNIDVCRTLVCNTIPTQMALAWSVLLSCPIFLETRLGLLSRTSMKNLRRPRMKSLRHPLVMSLPSLKDQRPEFRNPKIRGWRLSSTHSFLLLVVAFCSNEPQ